MSSRIVSMESLVSASVQVYDRGSETETPGMKRLPSDCSRNRGSRWENKATSSAGKMSLLVSYSFHAHLPLDQNLKFLGLSGRGTFSKNGTFYQKRLWRK